MALPVREQVTYWSIAILIFVAALFWLGDVLLPFVLGGALAYCLDPIADRLEEWGFSRVMATVLITITAVLVFVLVALLVVPMLVQQAIQLFNTAPQAFRDLQAFLTERFPSLGDAESPLRQSLENLGATIQSRGGQLLNTVLGTFAGVVNVLVLVVLVPVVTFYLLLDWDDMVAQVNQLLPLDHAPTIRAIASEIDQTLASFIRGQGTVCLILGTYYAIALMLAGLQFGLVVGVVAGLISFIPYVGAIFGGGLAIGLAVFQFWSSVEVVDGDTVRMGTDWLRIGLVAGIFFLGQIVEGNFLTPKLVGGSVGLHPVWLILALSVFGTLFGFIGMLVAVPVTAVLGVIARFGVGQYLQSRLYRGLVGRDADEE